ncbi:MAG: hypothetical protein ACKVU4_02675 [Phycisphaerales bacterium]
MPITNRSLVSELPGVSPAQAVALNRLGIDRVGDLLSADYDRVAVMLESFDEATRIVREAKQAVQDTSAAAAERAAPVTPAPMTTPASRAAASTARKPVGKQRPASKPAAPVAPPSAPARATATPPAPRMANTQAPARPVPAATNPTARARTEAAVQGFERRDDEGLGLALSLAARDLDLAEGGDEARTALARRLAAASTLLSHGSSEDETVTSLILEGVEDGSLQGSAVGRVFGDRVAQLVDECAALRAVPVSPLGKLPRYYLEMAGTASASARRVCAAQQLAHLDTAAEQPESNPDERGGAVWYARLLVEALEAGGPDPIIAVLRASLESIPRAAAA